MKFIYGEDKESEKAFRRSKTLKRQDTTGQKEPGEENPIIRNTDDDFDREEKGGIVIFLRGFINEKLIKITKILRYQKERKFLQERIINSKFQSLRLRDLLYLSVMICM